MFFYSGTCVVVSLTSFIKLCFNSFLDFFQFTNVLFDIGFSLLGVLVFCISEILHDKVDLILFSFILSLIINNLSFLQLLNTFQLEFHVSNILFILGCIIVDRRRRTFPSSKDPPTLRRWRWFCLSFSVGNLFINIILAFIYLSFYFSGSLS